MYRTRALGVNLEKGLLRILPSLSMGSRPDLSCLPSLTTPEALRDSRVPSKVSSRASCRRKLRDTRLTMVELSLRINRTVVKTARGPLTNIKTASCGR